MKRIRGPEGDEDLPDAKRIRKGSNNRVFASLDQDCMGHIARFLSNIEIINLCREVLPSNRQLRYLASHVRGLRIISGRIRDRLTPALGDAMVSALPSLGAVVAGGFVLESLLHEMWSGRFNVPDVDVFIKDGTKDIFGLLHQWVDIDNHGYIHDRDSKDLYPDQKDVVGVCDGYFKSRPHGTVIQILSTKGDPKEAVRDFDFDFCKVQYDGIRVTLWEVNAVLLRKQIKPNRLPPDQLYSKLRFINRVLKYRHRGFEVPSELFAENGCPFIGKMCLHDENLLIGNQRNMFWHLRRCVLTECKCIRCTSQCAVLDKKDTFGWSDVYND